MTVLGAITVLYSANDLYTTYLEANNALIAFNLKLEPLRTKLRTLETERNTIRGSGWKLIFSMLNPIDLAKTLFLSAGDVDRLLELDAAIIAVQIELEPYQAEMTRLESARDTAYDNYVAILSPSEEKPKKEPVTYVEIKEYRVECRNSCGTIFSSKDVGLANLADTAEKAHLILCASEPHKSNGIGYYSCPPDYVKVCPQSGEHWKSGEKLACRGQCGTLFPRLAGNIPDDSSHQTQTKCGEKARLSREVRIGGQVLTEEYVDDCPQGRYYHCNVGKACPNAGNHYSGSETVVSKYIDPTTGQPVSPPQRETPEETSGGNNDANTETVLCGNSNRGAGACSYSRISSSVNAHRTKCAAEHRYWWCNAKSEPLGNWQKGLFFQKKVKR